MEENNHLKRFQIELMQGKNATLPINDSYL